MVMKDPKVRVQGEPLRRVEKFNHLGSAESWRPRPSRCLPLLAIPQLRQRRACQSDERTPLLDDSYDPPSGMTLPQAGKQLGSRPGLESMTDHILLSDYEARRLLNALVKEFLQMTTEEMEETSDGNSLDRPISKRCSNLSTCVLGKLSQELHKLQTYPRTDVGAGTPGKKRNVVNELESERYVNYGERN
ncbi:CALC protein, partial [Polypterus senegalus]